ncbi:MAG: acetyltransferase [Methylovirgula sp.]
MNEKSYVILGGGGHARVIAEVLRILGSGLRGCVAPERPALELAGCPWLGDDDAQSFSSDEVVLANGIGSVGTVDRRRDVFLAWAGRGFYFPPIIHPNATIAGDVDLQDGVVVMAGAVLQSCARLAKNTIVNTNATVDHDCHVGAHSHVATGAILCGNVTLGPGVHVGAGAVIIQGVTVGGNAVIGAGAVVLADVPENSLAVGVPARVLRR